MSGSIYKKKEVLILILLLALILMSGPFLTCCVSAYYASALRGRQISFPESSFLLVSTKEVILVVSWLVCYIVTCGLRWSKTRVGSGDEIGRWREGERKEELARDLERNRG